MSLERQKRVKFKKINKGEDLAADESNRVFTERFYFLVIVRVRSVFDSTFVSFLDVEGLGSEGIGVVDRVTDVDVVEEDIFSHGPEFNTDTTLEKEKLRRGFTPTEDAAYNLGKRLDGGRILEIARVGNLTRCPFALVFRVVDHGSIPFALVFGVGLHRT